MPPRCRVGLLNISSRAVCECHCELCFVRSQLVMEAGLLGRAVVFFFAFLGRFLFVSRNYVILLVTDDAINRTRRYRTRERMVLNFPVAITFPIRGRAGGHSLFQDDIKCVCVCVGGCVSAVNVQDEIHFSPFNRMEKLR